MSNRWQYTFLCIGALAAGGLCYGVFREDTHIANFLRCVLNLSHFNGVRPTLYYDFLRFYLPDFLWGLALSFGLMAIYDPGLKGAVICAGVSFGCGCIWELLQYFGAVDGTGDLIDALIYLSASFLSIGLSKKEKEYEKLENNTGCIADCCICVPCSGKRNGRNR